MNPDLDPVRGVLLGLALGAAAWGLLALTVVVFTR